ncbi:MAG: GTP-binding protein [Lewinellaceae bacterium]|jgi:small GTP-binding protein|nr:GTP-binding protein [Lewinellaceae bacterium]
MAWTFFSKKPKLAKIRVTAQKYDGSAEYVWLDISEQTTPLVIIEILRDGNHLTHDGRSDDFEMLNELTFEVLNNREPISKTFSLSSLNAIPGGNYFICRMKSAASPPPAAPSSSPRNISELINIVIRVMPNGDELDVELPGLALGSEIITELLAAKVAPRVDPNGVPIQYDLVSKTIGKKMPPNQTVFDFGVKEGDVLYFLPVLSQNQDALTPYMSILKDLPDEVIRTPESIDSYIKGLNTQGDQARPLHECKVIFIGSGEVGKTSLIKKLITGQFDPQEKKTEGIKINDRQIRYDDKWIKTHIWDFGGQEIMHATHKFFMTRRSVYVLVLNPRVQDRYGETEVEYWLKLISSYARNAPIIVVCNKCEMHKMDLPKGQLMDKYPQISRFVETSCVQNIGIDVLDKAIADAVFQLEHINDLLPASFFKVKEDLQARNKDFIHYYEYRDICINADPEFGEENMQLLIGLLNDLGVMLNISDNRRLIETQVLNPQWITNGVYQIVNSKQILDSKGVISEHNIKDILDSMLYPTIKERGYIMDMMAHFELCYQLPDKPDTYFVPGAFSIDRPERFNWEQPEVLRFQYHYDVLPSSIMTRFMVKVHQMICTNQYWRNGVVIADEDDNSALIFADPSDRKIFIEVAGPEKRQMLSIIRREFEMIHKSISKLNVSRMISVDETGRHLCSYDDLLIYEKAGEQEVFIPSLRKKVSIKSLLEGVEIRINKHLIKQLIIDGEFKDALRQMEKLEDGKHQDILLMLGKLNRYDREIGLGLLDRKDVEIDYNRLCQLAIQFLDEIPG